MANYTYNDRGERILAVGAPDSIIRLRDERPVLIAKLQTMTKDEAKAFLAAQRYHFIKNITKIWRDNMLEAAFPSFLTNINLALHDQTHKK
jgi:hypothetical protein